MELHFQTTSDRALVAVGQTIVALGEVEIYGRKLIKQCIEIFTKNRPSNPMVGPLTGLLHGQCSFHIRSA